MIFLFPRDVSGGVAGAAAGVYLEGYIELNSSKVCIHERSHPRASRRSASSVSAIAKATSATNITKT